MPNVVYCAMLRNTHSGGPVNFAINRHDLMPTHYEVIVTTQFGQASYDYPLLDDALAHIVDEVSYDSWELCWETTPGLLDQAREAVDAETEADLAKMKAALAKEPATSTSADSPALVFELENTCGSSRKFWRVELEAGKAVWRVTSRWGHIGTTGRSKHANYSYVAQAVADIRSKVCDKRNHGYVWKSRTVDKSNLFVWSHLYDWSELNVPLEVLSGSTPTQAVVAAPELTPLAPSPAVTATSPIPGLRKLVLPKKAT